MKSVADHIHAKGLKAGIYLPVGLEKDAVRRRRRADLDAPGCTTADIVYPDLRTTNGWDSAYKLDFATPARRSTSTRRRRLLADWGYDFLKLDGVGPGSFKTGDNYDNVPDVAAWHAGHRRHRPAHPARLSWSLDIGHAADWKQYSNGWRIDTDVECYCNTLVTWDNSVDDRWRRRARLEPGTPGPGGWNDLDSLDVGNGAMDGLTKAERQSYMTLWAINNVAAVTPATTSPSSTRYGALPAHQPRGHRRRPDRLAGRAPGHPVGDQQVWRAQNADGSYTVALFNLGPAPARVSVRWSDVGFTGPADVHDVWATTDLGKQADGFTADVPSHGTRLLRVDPR